MSRLPSGLLLWLSCLCAAAEEAPPPAVKSGVDADLQKRIDEAIEKSRAYLERVCLVGSLKADLLAMGGADDLRQKAKMIRETAGKLRTGPHAANAGKQVAELEKKANELLQQADQLEKLLVTLKDPKNRKLAPTKAFQYLLGEQVLIGLALVQSGMKPSDPLLQQIWECARTSRDWGRYQGYTTSLALMLVDALMHSPSGEAWPPPEQKAAVAAWVKQAALSLAAGCDGGAWTYTCPIGGGGGKSYALGDKTVGSPVLVKAAVPTSVYDYSNSQYAVLGLKAASLAGFRIPEADSLWRTVAQQFLNSQEKEGPVVKLQLQKERNEPQGVDLSGPGWELVESGGKSRDARARGWGYISQSAPGSGPMDVQRRNVTGTMTAAGLTALLLAKSELDLSPDEKACVEEGIRDGLAWFQGNLVLGPEDGYLLYGVERLGVLGNVRTFGDRAWYPEGAQALVDAQGKGGSWSGGRGTAVNTAFGLLFLCRGTREAYARRSYEVTGSP